MKLLELIDEGSSAIFSEDRRFRYALIRRWDIGRSCVGFIGLNPSTADEVVNDPTVRRCIGFAKSWGYGGLLMLNAFAFRATDPAVMKAEPDPVGPGNDEALVKYAGLASLVVAAWGVHGAWMNRGTKVREILDAAGVRLHVLGLTVAGHPKHPLYLKKDLRSQFWSERS